MNEDSYPLQIQFDRPYDLWAAEAIRIHELLDQAGVPRTANAQLLSMSQRVEESLRMARIARQKD